MRLPDMVFAQLRHLLDMEENLQWEVGDFIRDVWVEIEIRVPDGKERKAHAEMINQMAYGTGADKSTLRSREKMSMFYTKEDRAKWDMYTYHQLRAIRKAGENWETVAEWGMTGGYNGGVATIDELRAKIDGEIDANELCMKRLIVLERKIRVILDDLSTPASVREGLVLVPTILEDTKELLHETLD